MRLERRALGDGAYEVVKEMILDQQVAPREHLNIDTLAPRLGVSQTPIREALARLEAEGLVVKEQPRGRYVVAPLLDATSFEDLFEVRLLLEPHAASLAAARIGKAELRALEQAAPPMHRAGRGSLYREYRNFSIHDAHFHELIAGAGGNATLKDTIVRLRSHHQLSRLYKGHGVDAPEGIAEHEAIIEAIRSGDAAAAATAMRRHIEGSRSRLRTFLDGGPERE